MQQHINGLAGALASLPQAMTQAQAADSEPAPQHIPPGSASQGRAPAAAAKSPGRTKAPGDAAAPSSSEPEDDAPGSPPAASPGAAATSLAAQLGADLVMPDCLFLDDPLLQLPPSSSLSDDPGVQQLLTLSPWQPRATRTDARTPPSPAACHTPEAADKAAPAAAADAAQPPAGPAVAPQPQAGASGRLAADPVLQLNVSGTVMAALQSTLQSVPGSRLCAMVQDASNGSVPQDSEGRLFLPFDAACFRRLLDALQEMQMFGEAAPLVDESDPAMQRQGIERLAKYLGLHDALLAGVGSSDNAGSSPAAGALRHRASGAPQHVPAHWKEEDVRVPNLYAVLNSMR